MIRFSIADGKRSCLLIAIAAFSLIWACSPGNEAAMPTGPDSDNDPVIDYPSATIAVRLSPSTVTRTHGNYVSAGVTATFRDAEGRPQQGLVVNFATDNIPVVLVDGTIIQGLFFIPASTLTDSNGIASTIIYIHPVIPDGSYTVSAFTNFINAPDTYGQSTLKVNSLLP